MSVQQEDRDLNVGSGTIQCCLATLPNPLLCHASSELVPPFFCQFRHVYFPDH